jgi:hypothetical protein
MEQYSIVVGPKEGGDSMWHQCLHRVAHGLVAVLVIAGSLTLLSCGGGDDDDNNTASSTTGTQLDPASTRGNVTSTNVATLANQDITIDASAFAFDTITAPVSTTLRIANVIPFNAIPGPGSASAALSSCLGSIAGANPTNLQVAANPSASANYTVARADGITFSGILCIGAGTTGTITTPGQGGNICVFTNSASSPSPGAQSIFTSCRLAVGVSPQQFVPVNTPLPGTLQLTTTNQRTNVAVVSLPNSVTVVVSDNGNNTGNVAVNGIPTGIQVDLITQTQ